MRSFDLNTLSDREREILNLAIEGLTDQQIGNKLNITPSTVNSYWVRIRGKLGRFSRTELVSKIVQQSANLESTSLGDRIRELESELKRVKSSSANYANSNLLRVALEANPEACVVFDGEAKVVLANGRFESLFDLQPGGGIGLALDDLFATGVRTSLDIDLAMLPDRARLGLTFPVFGSKRNGALFRAFLMVGIGEIQGEKFYSCVVRPFNDELQNAQSRASLLVAEHA